MKIKNYWRYLRYFMLVLLTLTVSIGAVSCDTDPLSGPVSPTEDEDKEPLDAPDPGGAID